MNEHEKIVENLSGRVYGVNIWTALHGITDFDKGNKALHQLVDGGRIIKKNVTIPGGGGGKFATYQLAPTFPTQLKAVK